ncbi:hypothetical protein AB6A40_010427 [Gnathostoma spinigerum]|uniref:Aquaporin n=1 Tax=Gnathostoma spinigerum TaxID=75299 RepID=A0ABD6EV85_9BILA
MSITPRIIPTVPYDSSRAFADNRKVSTVCHNENLDVPVHIERPYKLWSKLIAEFIGSILLVYIGSSQAVTSGNLLNSALAHGLTVSVLVSSLGQISGGHFNPAVTLAVLLCGKMKPMKATFYIISQFLGGILGSFLVSATLSHHQFVQIAGGLTVTSTDYIWFQGLVCEIILSFFLTQTVILTAIDSTKTALAPLAIGFTVCADILASGVVSGDSMNPARSFGPAVVSSIIGIDRPLSFIWNHHYIFWIGPAIGACCTALLYRSFLGRDENRVFC